MRFGRYAALADDDIWPTEIVGSLHEKLRYSRQPLSRSLGQAGFEALLQRRVLAVENAAALGGPFPLIAIGQGLYYESPIAFAAMAEYLAARGFVVATTPLVGTNSPLVKLDAQDLETEVRDLEFATAEARRLSFVSPERLGVLGFDMGGMAGLILAMRNADVDAFVSLDSGILYPHPAGIPRTSADYDPTALRVPWLHGTGAMGATPPDAAAKSLFDEATHSNRYLLVAKDMGHVDFTSYALIQGRKAMTAYWGPETTEGAASHAVVAEYVSNFFGAFLNHNAQSIAFLSRDTQDAFPGSGMTLDHRAATPAPIGYAEFVQAVIAGRADEAIDELRSVASVEPEHVLLNEMYLQRLGVSLLFTWDFHEEAEPVVEFATELHPTSAGAQMLRGYVVYQNHTTAIRIGVALALLTALFFLGRFVRSRTKR
jgi:pimeloyl-ACP methyl ester carboxylesterase